MKKIKLSSLDNTLEKSTKENLSALKDDIVKKKFVGKYKKIENNIPKTIKKKKESIKRKTYATGSKQLGSMVRGLVRDEKQKQNEPKKEKRVISPTSKKVSNKPVLEKTEKSKRHDISQVKAKIATTYESLQASLSNQESEEYKKIKTECEASLGHEATAEEVDTYIIENDTIAALALTQTIAELHQEGWNQEEITTSLQQVSQGYISEEESDIFDVYIQESVDTYFVFYTAPSEGEEYVSPSIPGAKSTFEDAVADGAIDTKVMIASLSGNDKKKIFTHILKRKATQPYTQEQMKYLQEKYENTGSGGYVKNEEMENEIVSRRKQTTQKELTHKARVQEFAQQTKAIKTLLHSTDDDTSVRATDMTYTYGLKTRMKISTPHGIYTKKMNNNSRIPSLRGGERRIGIDETHREDIYISVSDALQNRLPSQDHEIEDKHKEQAQKYIYQECVLEEVCNSMRREDTTKSIDTVAGENRILLKTIDQILGKMNVQQLKDILGLLQQDVWQISMTHSTLPKVLEHQDENSNAPNNIARFFWSYIGKQVGPIGKNAISVIDADRFDIGHIYKKTQKWNETLLVTNDMEKEHAIDDLGKMLEIQGLELEDKGSDIYAVHM